MIEKGNMTDAEFIAALIAENKKNSRLNKQNWKKQLISLKQKKKSCP